MKKIILASKSPRRIEMFSKYLENIRVISADIEEKVNISDSPHTTTMKIAFEKASAVYDVLKEQNEDGIIISADTVVYLNHVIGKPENYEDAFNTLKYLSGKEHSVYTGFCIWDIVSNIKVVDFEKTIVVFNCLTDDDIRNYLKTKEYEDKAGSYGIQGYGEILVKKIDGCYNNVVGLPLNKLNILLKKHFNQGLL